MTDATSTDTDLWVGPILRDPNCRGCAWLYVEIRDGVQVVCDANEATEVEFGVLNNEDAVLIGKLWLGSFPTYEVCGEWAVGEDEGDPAYGRG